MVHYKYTYFDIRALGEVSRLILHYADVPFEDERLSREEWQKIKPTTAYGQLPYLTIDGTVVIAQSYAIARLLAKRYGLAGKDDIEAAQADSVADLLKDFYSEAFNYVYVCAGMHEGDKDKIYNEIFVPSASKHLPLFVKVLKDSGSGFFVKSGVTWADFAVANAIQNLINFAPEIVQQYPEILEHHKRVHSIPQLQKYLSVRKVTDV